MNNKYKVYETINSLNITYEITDHPPVFTIEEINNLGITFNGNVVKNLFLKDTKGKRHFIFVLNKNKKADLKALRIQLQSTALSFASEDMLLKYLNLTKGSVSPLGVLNDKNTLVEVVFDKDLIDEKRIGVHPNDNTATIWLSFNDLRKIIESNGNKITYIEI